MSFIVDVVVTDLVIDVVPPSEEIIDIVIADGAIDVIETLEAGPPGAKGDDGAPGPQGDPGPPGGNYRHVQSTPAAVWTVVHNLGFWPGGIFAKNSDNQPIIGRVEHLDTDTLTISFFANGVAAAMGGEAFIS